MKILVTGSGGLVGSALVRQLTAGGHFVVRLVRSNPLRERGDVVWDPVTGRVERNRLEKMDAGWKVYDVVVAGISLVTNYRDQFGQEVRNGGVDGLIASIAAKNKSLEANQKK